MTVDQRFVGRLYRLGGQPARRKFTWERVQVDDRLVAIIDTHPEGSSTPVVEIRLDDRNRVVRVRYAAVTYPFLNLDGKLDEVTKAVRAYLRSRR